MKKKQLLCVLLTGIMLLVPYSGVLAEEPEIQTEELTLASGVEGEEAMITALTGMIMTEGRNRAGSGRGRKTETISYKDTSVTDEDNGNIPGKGGDLPERGAPFQSGEQRVQLLLEIELLHNEGWKDLSSGSQCQR